MPRYWGVPAGRAGAIGTVPGGEVADRDCASRRGLGGNNGPGEAPRCRPLPAA